MTASEREKKLHDEVYAMGYPTGVKLLHSPNLNKGTAFTEEERETLGLRGLLPPRISSQEDQVAKVLENFDRKENDLQRYIYMVGLEDRNEHLFYRVVMENIEKLMPIIYTPTVGQACQLFGHIWRRPRGLYVTAEDRGRVSKILGNWPHRKVAIIVVTDGERILGLGDLGANGMGIPVGKLALYTACAGVDPTMCLPITIDVGTENDELLSDPLYIGLQQRRLKEEAYDELMDEFMDAVNEVFPNVLVQLEDFSNKNAFRLLRKYRNRYCCFDDDIQGTAAVSLAGFYSALRLTGQSLKEQKLLFVGAGEAGIGIADLTVAAMISDGLSKQAAQEKCWFMDSKGLVVKSRDKLQDHKVPYAHDHEFVADLLTAIKVLQPSVLIGVSGQPQTFTKPIIEAMTKLNERPIVFALSNPTSKSECTAEQAYQWSKGRAIFASGSPFPPYPYKGKTYVPGQGNNAYIFPGVGLGVIACGATRVTEEMFFAAAKALACEVSNSDLGKGSIYPPLRRIRETSASIATAAAEVVYRQDLATKAKPENLRSFIESQMYQPDYPNYVGVPSK
jgi:malate dehydrogenase (oxaloacetate-decarboxylating)(NADP+)